MEKIISDINSVICEELSINSDVLTILSVCYEEIGSKIKNHEQNELEDGILISEFKLSEKSINGFTIYINVKNFDFKNKAIYDRKYDKYVNNLNSSSLLPILKRKKFYLTINTCSISGNLIKNISLNNLQHELEHVLQMSLSSKALPKNSKVYADAITLMNNSDINSIQYKIGRGLYLSFQFEQDGFLNGFYQEIINNEYFLTWDDIIDTEIYHILSEIDDIINGINTKSYEPLLRNIFSISTNNFRKTLLKSRKRLINKIGHILTLHRNEIIKNGGRLTETIGNNMHFYF